MRAATSDGAHGLGRQQDDAATATISVTTESRAGTPSRNPVYPLSDTGQDKKEGWDIRMDGMGWAAIGWGGG